MAEARNDAYSTAFIRKRGTMGGTKMRYHELPWEVAHPASMEAPWPSGFCSRCPHPGPSSNTALVSSRINVYDTNHEQQPILPPPTPGYPTPPYPQTLLSPSDHHPR